MSDNKLNKKMEEFINDTNIEKAKEIVIKPKTGLIEVKQLEKKIITEDGRQLLI